MMKQTLGFLVLGAATFACSGRYYEVGGMDAAGGVGGTRGAAGGAAPGGNSGSTAGTPDMTDPGVGAGAGTNNAGPATSTGLCVPGAPAKLTGPFAEPAVVWRRISMLTWGTAMPPPTALPATTTYEWAGAAVTVALQDAREVLGTAPGVENFLRQALGLEASAPFMQHWGVLLSTDSSLLNALLRAPLGEPDRVGIFTEPSVLAGATTISARAEVIESVLFDGPIPLPPESVDKPDPDPTLQDRAALEALTNEAVCRGCHQYMDPTGYALGHFAADGSYRELDHGMPIDVTGWRDRNQGVDGVEFDGIADFGAKFENHCEALRGIAGTFLHAAIVLTEAPRDSPLEENLERVQQAFVNSDRTYEALVTAYIQSPVGLRP